MPRSHSPKKPITKPALKSWVALNTFLMSTTSVPAIEKLLTAELAGRQRQVFLSRIRSRLLKLHTQAQRAQLEQLK